MSVLNFLLKNLQGCCLLFNYQGSFSLLSSQRQLIYIITFTIACQQLFYFFRCPLRSSLSFETAYLEYHFYRHLSTGNFIYFFAFPWALKHFPVLSHATACIIYHAYPELSILFLLFILFAQFTQFQLSHFALLVHICSLNYISPKLIPKIAIKVSYFARRVSIKRSLTRSISLKYYVSKL